MENTQNFLRPIDNTSVVQQVINRLTLAMINKDLRPGDKIPTESTLSTNFGVGRNSIREAIKILVSFGVLEIRRPEGTFVTKGFSDKMIDPLLYGIILDDGGESIDSLKDLREWIDVGILRLAIKRATQEDIKILEDRVNFLKRGVAEKNINKIYEADNLFHEELVEITKNSLFAKIANLVRILTSEIRLKTIEHMVDIKKEQRMVAVHEEMLQAIKERNMLNVDNIINDSYLYSEGVLKQ